MRKHSELWQHTLYVIVSQLAFYSWRAVSNENHRTTRIYVKFPFEGSGLMVIIGSTWFWGEQTSDRC